jgi:hypothetical protein
MSEETLNQEQQVEEVVLQTESLDEVENLSMTAEPQEEISEMDQLIARRMGSFNVSLSLSDLKYLRNKLNDVTWTGPNEAYLQIMAVVAINNEIRNIENQKDTNTRHTVSLPSTTIESINFFLSRVSGKGEEGAHRLFAVSMLLRSVMEEIKNMDADITAARNSQDSEKN